MCVCVCERERCERNVDVFLGLCYMPTNFVCGFKEGGYISLCVFVFVCMGSLRLVGSLKL